MDKDSFRSWKESAETLEVQGYFKNARENLMEYLCGGGATDMFEYGRLVGRIEALKSVTEVTHEDLEDDA